MNSHPLNNTAAAKLPLDHEHLEFIVLGMGCFWGAERRMSALPGVVDVQSGYANGEVPGTYEDVLSTERARKLGVSTARNHAEVVKVLFDTRATRLAVVLAGFWENHDPTQGDRQGEDIGSNYRSAIYTQSAAQFATALATQSAYQAALTAQGFGTITTEIQPLTRYIAAEEYHQAYLVKNPGGYCGLGGTGVSFPLESLTALGSGLLDEDQRRIAFEKGTERAFSSSHLDETRLGTFVDPITGAALFRSDAKFDSGTGWPSFFCALPDSITLHEDASHGMLRVEVRSASSGIHLGHVFDDGPPPTGKRYCINGKVLNFVADAAAMQNPGPSTDRS